MKIRRIAAFMLMAIIVLLCPVSCGQRKQAAPQTDKDDKKESSKGHLIYINADSPDKTMLYSYDIGGKKKEKAFEKNPYSAVGHGEKIAFMTKENGKQTLYMSKADGSELITIASNIPIKTNSLSWSPDGGKLVFIARVPGDKSDEVYYIEGGKNSTPVKVTDDTSADDSPKFSSDGKMILYTKVLNNNHELYKYEIAEQKHINLSNNGANDLSPAVSPDGTKILFLSDEKAKGIYNLYMMGIDGGGRTELTTDLDIVKDSIKISPDSRMVSFVSADTRKNKTVHVIDMNKSTVMISDDAYMTAWSGDSKTLYYATYDPKNRKIMEYDVTGRSAKDVLKVEYKPGEESTGIKFLHFTDKPK